MGKISLTVRYPALAPAEAKNQEGRQGADGRAEPVGAVDPDIGAAPVARGRHLVDRRVDRRVLAADAHAGDDPGRVQVDDPAGWSDSLPNTSARITSQEPGSVLSKALTSKEVSSDVAAPETQVGRPR